MGRWILTRAVSMRLCWRSSSYRCRRRSRWRLGGRIATQRVPGGTHPPRRDRPAADPTPQPRLTTGTAIIRGGPPVRARLTASKCRARSAGALAATDCESDPTAAVLTRCARCSRSSRPVAAPTRPCGTADDDDLARWLTLTTVPTLSVVGTPIADCGGAAACVAWSVPRQPSGRWRRPSMRSRRQSAEIKPEKCQSESASRCSHSRHVSVALATCWQATQRQGGWPCPVP